MNFQSLILELSRFWAREGCLIVQPCDLELGAGVFSPAVFFGALSPAPAAVACVEPCRRPADGRGGESPDRLGKYHRFRVMFKPAPADIAERFLRSFKALGLDRRGHDLRWIDDDWESAVLGASGSGWQVRLDGLEVARFTYLQALGSRPLAPVPVAIGYGLERLALRLQRKKSVFELDYSDRVTYGDLHLLGERQSFLGRFEEVDPAPIRRRFDEAEAEGERLAGLGLALPAYERVARLAHLLDLLDAAGALPAAEREGLALRIRGLAVKSAGQGPR
ncbi:MAG: glycine--tRNA ligase subunit alpha [Elusimicrobia bacterium]|nr:glycine--tRNA ligase subunit alpha [Elusimicrobiota bacterium]